MAQTNYIYLIEDDQDLGASLRSILEGLGYVVHLHPSAEDFLKTAHVMLFPGVILADMILPGMSGVEMYEKLRELDLRIPVVFLSGESTNRQIITAHELGAVKFLLKPVDLQELLNALASGIERCKAQMELAQRKAVYQAGLQRLSPREREVFELLAKGFSNAEIQEKLQIALPTAKQYKSDLMRKLGIRRLSELIEMRGSIG